MIPNVSPYRLPVAICSNGDCSRKLRTVVTPSHKGGLATIMLYCDNCLYGYRISPEHINGDFVKHDSGQPTKSKPKATEAPAEPKLEAPTPA